MPTPMPKEMSLNATTGVYTSADGWALQREQGMTPNGNPISNRWVLRGADGAFMDVDQYRYDIAEKHDLVLVER